MEENNNPSNVSSASKIVAVIGIAIIILSIFSPMLVITGFRYMVLSLMDLSGLLSVTVIISCAMAILGILLKKYEFITIVSNGLIIYFFAIIGLYLRAIDGAAMVFLDITFGALIFLFGAVIMEIGGILCGLSADSEEKRNFITQWFHYSKKSVSFNDKNISGLLISPALGILLVMLTFTAELLRS